MKKLAAAALALACSLSETSWAGGSFTGSDAPFPPVKLVRVTLEPNGAVAYEMSGALAVGQVVFNFTGVGAYSPASHKATELINQEGGNRIQTVATCQLDPWQFGASTCSNPLVNVKGYGPDLSKYITSLGAPMSVVGDRTPYVLAVQAAEKAAAIKKARLQHINNAMGEMFPTPTPTPRYKTGITNAEGIPSVSPTKAMPTPTPVYPLYGALYTGGTPATMKVGTSVMVPITVQNTSSQTWPAGGNFHLSFHWYRGGGTLVRDGDRTFMPTSVPPGGTVNLMAKVTAPPSAGATTLQWDMVQEGVAWFSDKGVPMSAPKSVNVTP